MQAPDPAHTDPDALLSNFIAEHIRRRTLLRLSHQQLADRMGFHRTYVAKIEGGNFLPTESYARQADAALEADGALWRLWEPWDHAQRALKADAKIKTAAGGSPLMNDRPPITGGAVLVAQIQAALGHAGSGWITDAVLAGASVEFDDMTVGGCRVRVAGRVVVMERQDFLMLSAFCTALGVGIIRRVLNSEESERLAAAMRRPEITDPSVVEHLQRVLVEQREVDDIVGPRYLLKSVGAQVEMIERLIHGARSDVRELLLPVAGEWAQFSWWLSIDAHDLPQAHSMYNKASEWAHEGAGAKLGGYLLSCKSELAAIGGDYQEARQLAEAAQRDVWQPTPALASWALLRQAHAHAFVGEYSECQAKLGEAEELLTASNSAEEPPYIYWFEPEYLSGDRGMCYIALGRGEQGAEQIDAELRVLAPDRLRDRGWCLARQGEAYVLAGEPDRASAVIGEALAISQATGSTRILEKVRSVRGWFPERWRELPATRDLDEQIHDADGPAL